MDIKLFCPNVADSGLYSVSLCPEYLSHCDGGQWCVTDGPCQYLVIIILSYLAQGGGRGGRGRI